MEERVATKAARRGQEPPPLQVVQFAGRRRRPEEAPSRSPQGPANASAPPPPQFNLKRARFEVSRLCEQKAGSAASRLEAKQQLALALGARPPKNPASNYK